MAGQGAGRPPIEAFVNEDAQGSYRLKHREFTGFDHGDGLLAFDRREGIEKIFDGFASLLFSECLDRVSNRAAAASSRIVSKAE